MRPNKMRRRSAPTAYTWIAPVSLQDYPLDAGHCGQGDSSGGCRKALIHHAGQRVPLPRGFSTPGPVRVMDNR